MRSLINLILIIVSIFILSPGSVLGACPDDDYENTTCLYGETGTCRRVCDLTSTKINATITASSGTGTGLSADGASFNGDGVYLPAGTATWTANVNFSSKNVLLAGQGIATNINPGAYKIYIGGSNPERLQFRITNIKFSGAVSAQVINIFPQDFTSAGGGWRIDHLTIDVTGGDNPIDIQEYTWGVIDNCFIRRDGKAVRISAYANSMDTGTPKVRGSYERSLAMGYGSANAIYVEDCTLVNTGATSASVAEEIDLGGGSMVLRHNTIWRGMLFGKYTRATGTGDQPTLGPKKIEVYSNTWHGVCDDTYCSSSLTPTASFGRFSGGTGLVYNNTISGYTSGNMLLDDYRAKPSTCSSMGWDGVVWSCCDGTLSQTWDGNKECTNGSLLEAANGDGSCPTAGYTNTGYPCAGQVGYGSGSPGSQENSPWYEWNNGPEATCKTGGTCSNGMDFYTDIPLYVRSSASPHPMTESPYEYANNTEYSYSPYTYPHPLRGTSGAPTVTVFIIPATSTSLIVPITTFAATDDFLVAGYKLTETSATPAAGDPGWTATAPTSFTFSESGNKTLYAWAKDAEGNVSTSLNDSVVISTSGSSSKYGTASASIVTGWTNLSNLYSADDARASATATTATGAVTGFGFNVDSGATILGIKIELEGQGNQSTAARRGIAAGPTKNGTGLAADDGAQINLSRNVDGIVTWGANETTLWNTTWTPAEINASTFGVLIHPAGTTGYSRLVDWVRVTVFYEFASDTVAPVITDLLPNQQVVCSTDPRDVVRSWKTDEDADCRVHATSTTWAEMSPADVTGARVHSDTVSQACGAAYTLKVVCQDADANESAASTISYNIASPAVATQDTKKITHGAGSQRVIRGGGSQNIVMGQ